MTKLNIDDIHLPSRKGSKGRVNSRRVTVKVNLLAYDRQLTTGGAGSGRHIGMM